LPILRIRHTRLGDPAELEEPGSFARLVLDQSIRDLDRQLRQLETFAGLPALFSAHLNQELAQSPTPEASFPQDPMPVPARQELAQELVRLQPRFSETEVDDPEFEGKSAALEQLDERPDDGAAAGTGRQSVKQDSTLLSVEVRRDQAHEVFSGEVLL
jgi:hypothetical protein